jgi:hypothetical protein
MCARRDEDAALCRHQRTAAEPARRGILVGLRAAKALVAQQGYDVAQHMFGAGLHPLDQFGIIRLGRQVHRQVDGTGRKACRRAPRSRLVANEGSLSDLRFNQPTLLGLDIAACDGGEIDIETLGEFPLWRQAIADHEPSGSDVVGNRICDCEIARLVAVR